MQVPKAHSKEGQKAKWVATNGLQKAHPFGASPEAGQRLFCRRLAVLVGQVQHTQRPSGVEIRQQIIVIAARILNLGKLSG